MNTYYLEPCLALNDRERTRLRNAIHEVEHAIHLLDAPNGLRVFDAHVTTAPTRGQYAGNAFVIKQHTKRRIKPRKTKRRRWWRLRRAR